MFQLAYASTATGPVSPDVLASLLARARVKNQRLGITGLLLCREGRFLQVLEGRQHHVRALYDTVRADERHSAVITLRERLVEARDFPDCAMGFADLERTDAKDLPEACVPLANGSFTMEHFRKDPAGVHRSLVQLREVGPLHEGDPRF